MEKNDKIKLIVIVLILLSLLLFNTIRANNNYTKLQNYQEQVEVDNKITNDYIYYLEWYRHAVEEQILLNPHGSIRDIENNIQGRYNKTYYEYLLAEKLYNDLLEKRK